MAIAFLQLGQNFAVRHTYTAEVGSKFNSTRRAFNNYSLLSGMILKRKNFKTIYTQIDTEVPFLELTVISVENKMLRGLE